MSSLPRPDRNRARAKARGADAQGGPGARKARRDDKAAVRDFAALLSKGKNSEAEAMARRLVTRRPDFAPGWNMLGAALAARRNFGEAVLCYQRALQIAPDSASTYNNLGLAFFELGRIDPALVCYRRALEIDGRNVEACNNLGNALTVKGETEDAIACYRAALAMRPGYAEAHANLGNALATSGRLKEAEACHRRAIELKPDSVSAHCNLGVTLADQGDVEGAEAAYRKALALRPGDSRSFRNLAMTRRVGADDPLVADALRRFADPATTREDRIQLGFGLGHLLEREGRCEEAFDHLLEANRLHRMGLRYNRDRQAERFAAIREAFPPSALARPAGGDPTRQPIFIVGMPRSGTTLVEQILSSHENVFGAGELEQLRLETQRIESLAGTAYPQGATKLTDEHRRQLADGYLARLRRDAPAGIPHITDKMPHNFVHLGLLRQMLPEARIIHVRRDPLDCCISMFSLLFSTGHDYAYDLAELGDYYRLYTEMMAYWQQAMPEGILEVRYEELIGDLEGGTRRMLDFCGLEFDERCLAFHENRRAVRTASNMQVREPVHARSVGRWRRFESRLGPLIEALGPVAKAESRTAA